MLRLITNITLGPTALGALPRMACAQTPGTRLQGSIEVVGVDMHGDTVSIRYRVRAEATTPETFFSLTLPLPQFAITVRADTASRLWHSSNRIGRRPVATWDYVGEAPMLVSPPLSSTAIGVPELADAWIEGYQEPFVEGTPQADSAIADTTGYQYGARKLRLVGVGPRASTLTLDQRLTRLGAALSERCRFGFVTGPGLCASLTAKLTATQNSIARRNSNAAIGQLGAFKAEVSAQRGKGVDETTYWLLTALADVALAGLPLH
jgi:hypothetical protein